MTLQIFVVLVDLPEVFDTIQVDTPEVMLSVRIIGLFPSVVFGYEIDTRVAWRSRGSAAMLAVAKKPFLDWRY